MRPSFTSLWVSFALLFVCSASGAESPGCGAVEFSRKVLDRFPNVSRACLDVVSRDGDAYGVFKAKIVRVYDHGNAIDLRFELPDGSLSETRKLKTNPALRVMVQGKPTRVSDLVIGDQLMAYVKVREPELALAPAEPAIEPQYVELEEVTVSPPQLAATATMPSTAGYLSAIGLAGTVSLLLGAALSIRRRRRAR